MAGIYRLAKIWFAGARVEVVMFVVRQTASDFHQEFGKFAEWVLNGFESGPRSTISGCGPNYLPMAYRTYQHRHITHPTHGFPANAEVTILFKAAPLRQPHTKAVNPCFHECPSRGVHGDTRAYSCYRLSGLILLSRPSYILRGLFSHLCST